MQNYEQIDAWKNKTFKTKENFSVENPFNQDFIYSLPEMNSAHTIKAIDILEEGFAKWLNKDINYRTTLLLKWADALEKHSEELSELLTKEQGKPL